jgi:pimeloyl-ACP methyl ester carboxylesterase
MLNASRLVLFPGLGADERLFSRIALPCLPLTARSLPVPDPAEDMAAYARRVAQLHNICDQDIIGGCSFGSLVAAEIARQRAITGLVLLGGATSSTGLTPGARILARLLPTTSLAHARPLLARRVVLNGFLGPADNAILDLLLAMLADTPDAMLIQGVRLIRNYRPTTPLHTPVYAIHGARDRAMRPPAAASRLILPGAGHAIVLSHAPQVSEQLRRWFC